MTKGYWLADQVKVSRSAYLAKRWRKVTRLLMADGEVLRTIPPPWHRGHEQHHHHGMAQRPQAEYCSRVDLQALQRLRNWLDDVLRVYDSSMVPHDLVTEFPPKRLHRAPGSATAQVIRMAKTDVAGHGFVTHRYVQAAGVWRIEISFRPYSAIKQAALAGLWEYDFSNCHFTLQAQMAARAAALVFTEAIAHYLSHKKATRQAVPAKAGITEAQAKLCLLAVMYGARASEECLRTPFPGRWARGYGTLSEVGEFKAISADGLSPQDHPKALAQAHQQCGRLATTLAAPSTAKSPASRLTALAQGVEALALKAVIDLYPHHIWYSTTVLPPPQGWIAAPSSRRFWRPRATGWSWRKSRFRPTLTPFF